MPPEYKSAARASPKLANYGPKQRKSDLDVAAKDLQNPRSRPRARIAPFSESRYWRAIVRLERDSHGSVAVVKTKKPTGQSSYSLPLPPVVLLGSLLSATFFGLILSGPLDFEILRRYCLSHPVAIASVSLFFIGAVGLAYKWYLALKQSQITSRAAASLRRLIDEGDEVLPADRAHWLFASWQAQPPNIRDSWFGARLIRVLELQISRGRRSQLERDLESLSNADADRQHESYSLLRIINWAMPMLGFLGTVLGISQTLGQLDTELLATQQQEAMNQLTAGLYVAFDTTAIALSLTVVSMFGQFGISRIELNLLSRVDSESADILIGFLSADPFDAQAGLLEPLRDMTTELVASVRSLVEDQAKIWSRSLAESQRQWTAWTDTTSNAIEQQFSKTLSSALEQHIGDLRHLQDENSRHIDLRSQQWQTTLSDQARISQSQQKELVRQTETLQKLVESVTDVTQLETAIQESVARLENLNRLEEASACVGEAVAFLATSLERAGLIRGAPVKPRIARAPDGSGSERKAA